MANEPVTCAIFDCDGTLLDSMGAWRSVEARLAESNGVVLTKEDRDALTTFSIPECGRYFHETLGIGASSQAVQDEIISLMLDFYSNDALPKPGAAQLVEGLARAGVPMCVASSTPKAALMAGIEHAGMLDLMKAVLSVDDVGASKRNPKIYLRACEAAGSEPARAWVFEDAVYALRTAKDAGFRTFAVYDNDDSGTFEELSAVADASRMTFEGFSAEDFLALADGFETD